MLTNCKPNKENVLVKKNFFSEEGLRKWNNATTIALDSFITFDRENQRGKVELIRNSLNTGASDDTILLREKYIDLMHKSVSIRDSIPYDTFFLVEHEFSGEENWIEKYLIVNQGDSSTLFYTRYTGGFWNEPKLKKVKLLDLSNFLEEVPPYTKGHYWGGILTITKFSGDKIASKFYTNLSRENYIRFNKLIPYFGS